MQKIFQILFAILALYNSNSLVAQTTNPLPKWGLETELIQPFLPDVGIFRLQATLRLTGDEQRSEGDLLLGTYLRPNVKHDIVEKINEYLLITGYRQYLWKGLHLEGKSNIGYAWGTKNRIDGKDYNNFSWFWEANLGYKVNFAQTTHSNLYVIGQFGGIGSITSNIGPRGGEGDIFPQGNLLIGINF